MMLKQGLNNTITPSIRPYVDTSFVMQTEDNKLREVMNSYIVDIINCTDEEDWYDLMGYLQDELKSTKEKEIE